jgi:hypothetical protein
MMTCPLVTHKIVPFNSDDRVPPAVPPVRPDSQPFSPPAHRLLSVLHKIHRFTYVTHQQ